MSWSRSKVWSRIEDAVTGRLRPAQRKTLFEEVRENPQARADYDLAFEALRELERAPVAQAELDVVEAWLMGDLRAAPEATPAWLRRPWLIAALAVVAAGALVMVVTPPQPVDHDDAFGVRGGAEDRHLAIDALCPQGAGASVREGLVPAAEYGCGLDGTLSFAYRIDPAAAPGVLTLFGVDDDGDVLYYAPTPGDPNGVDAAPGTWTPLPMVVQLEVNHEPGAIVVHGLLSPQAPTVAQVDAMAAALVRHRAEFGPPGMSAPPWHERLAEIPTVAALCPEDAECESAELTFTIHEVLP